MAHWQEGEKHFQMKGKAIAIASIVAVGAVVACIATVTYQRSKTFIPGSYIGNVNVGKMNEIKAGEVLDQNFMNKSITLKTSDREETIKLSDVAKYNGGTAASKAYQQQKSSFFNTLPFREGKKYKDDGFKIIDSRLKIMVSGKSFMSSTDAPKNAYVEYKNGKVSIVPEHLGSQYDAEKTIAYIKDGIKSGEEAINLNDRRLMKNPSLTKDSNSIQNQAAALTKVNGHKITLTQKGRKNVVLDSARYMKYVTADSNGKLSVNDKWLSGYAASLTSNFGTVGKPVTFTDANGKKRTIAGGTFGNTVNVAKEKEQLKKDILSGKDITRNVISKTNGNNTLGRTYIEVNIAAQKVTGYKNGKKVVESAVVTGRNDDPERRTHRGAYYIFYKKSPAVLRGPGYASPVHVFAAFSGGQGFHDADGWRSVYGGSIYQHSGSHGCVNMPRQKAELLYRQFGIGTPVVVF